MKTVHKEIPFADYDTLTKEIFTENSIFFDIETTGFSPAHTSLYLIGCARRSGSIICIDQFFAEHPDEEKLILSAFLELLKQYDTIITFNGIGFDIPYLKAKCNTYNLADQFSSYTYVDIFKSVTQLKHMLKLTSLKQKSIETFLGIDRDDLCSGKELIQVYHSYCKEPESDLLDLLLLHNYEDVLGMIQLIPVLSYVHLMNGSFAVATTEVHDKITYQNEQEKELILTLTPEFSVPKRISYGCDPLYLTALGDTCKISVRLTQGELKYFFANYKDYYYLPDEDMAVHKSVASFVDKTHRENARASTCYTRHPGLFAPQFQEIITPSFKKNYNDKHSYFELTEHFLHSDELLNAYVKHLLFYLKAQKR